MSAIATASAPKAFTAISVTSPAISYDMTKVHPDRHLIHTLSLQLLHYVPLLATAETLNARQSSAVMRILLDVLSRSAWQHDFFEDLNYFEGQDNAVQSHGNPSCFGKSACM
jgi:hypothetical protein